MPLIPDKINDVTVEFAPVVNRSVDQKLIDALRLCIKADIAAGYRLAKIYISSANDQHRRPSRHVLGAGKAVDISRINDKRMSLYYPTDSTVKAVTDAIQVKFEDYKHKRENFGPCFKKKEGIVKAISGHCDHIHLSVD